MTPFLIHGFVVLFPILSLVVGITYIFRWSPWKKIKTSQKIDTPPLEKISLSAHNSDYPFACGPASIQMLLDKLWILVSQDTIAEINWKISVGTSPWEVKKLLNTIFSLHKSHYCAKVYPYTSFEMIQQNLYDWEPVFVLLVIKFHEEWFSNHAYYPHFCLITHIADDTITLQSPFYKRNHWENSLGELIFSFDDFLEKFYVYPSVIKQLEFRPRYVKNIFLRIRNRYINFGFVFYIFASYYLWILHPGISIQIEKN